MKNYTVWKGELARDRDRDFILDDIKNGFDIVDQVAVPTPVEPPNNCSARPCAPMYAQATQQICKEIEQGNYVLCPKSQEISPSSPIPKPDGGVHLIHDGSQPPGGSMNDYATSDHHDQFQIVDEAARLMAPGWYMARVALKSAYCSVPISEHSEQFTGLKWEVDGQPFYLKDIKLPVWSKFAPGIFHRFLKVLSG